MIDYECENKHKGNILLKEYINIFNKFSLSKEKCKDCEKNQKKVKGYLFYCSKCNKFICYSCLRDHPFGDKHIIINFQKYDSLCKIYSCVELNDGTIASGGEGDGYSIKLWKDFFYLKNSYN